MAEALFKALERLWIWQPWRNTYERGMVYERQLIKENKTMSYKRLIPCIFIYKGKAIKWFDDKEVVSDDVIGLAKQYCDKGADELIVFDLSNTDDEHDEAIDLMKK